MRAQGAVPGVESEYIPKARDNRKEPEPIKLIWRTLNSGTKRTVLDGERISGAGVILSMDSFRRKLLIASILSVHNYERPSTIGWEPIEDGADLADHGDTQIVDEIFFHFLESFSLGEEGNEESAESSASTQAGTNPSDGTAVNVQAADSTNEEAVIPDNPVPRASSTLRA